MSQADVGQARQALHDGSAEVARVRNEALQIIMMAAQPPCSLTASKSAQHRLHSYFFSHSRMSASVTRRGGSL